MDLMDVKQLFLKFWRSDDDKITFIRDILVAVIVVLLILSILWGYTGQWFGAPMVAIESGSMMHAEEGFGRVGYIDAGDMVLLVKVQSEDDIVVRGEKKFEDNPGLDRFFSYGEYGDVIVYKKNGGDETPIIHRAFIWMELNKTTKNSIDFPGLKNLQYGKDKDWYLKGVIKTITHDVNESYYGRWWDLGYESTGENEKLEILNSFKVYVNNFGPYHRAPENTTIEIDFARALPRST